MNVGDIQTRVKRAFGDESGVQVTDADIIRWINDGQRQIVLQNEGLFEKTVTTDTVINQSQYDVPTDMLTLLQVSFKSDDGLTYPKLRGLSLNEFNEYIEPYSSQTGTPLAFTVYEKKIRLFPIPDKVVSAGIKVFYNRAPVEVSLVTDVPEIDVLYHESLVKYCMLQAYEMDENLEAATFKGQQVVADINLLRGKDTWKEQGVYPSITVLNGDAW